MKNAATPKATLNFQSIMTEQFIALPPFQSLHSKDNILVAYDVALSKFPQRIQLYHELLYFIHVVCKIFIRIKLIKSNLIGNIGAKIVIY